MYLTHVLRTRRMIQRIIQIQQLKIEYIQHDLAEYGTGSVHDRFMAEEAVRRQVIIKRLSKVLDGCGRLQVKAD